MNEVMKITADQVVVRFKLDMTRDQVDQSSGFASIAYMHDTYAARCGMGRWLICPVFPMTRATLEVFKMLRKTAEVVLNCGTSNMTATGRIVDVDPEAGTVTIGQPLPADYPFHFWRPAPDHWEWHLFTEEEDSFTLVQGLYRYIVNQEWAVSLTIPDDARVDSLISPLRKRKGARVFPTWKKVQEKIQKAKEAK